MYDNSYVEEFISACISLRKVRSLVIKQPQGEFKLRPQSHVMLVSPFGTFKSSLIRKLRSLNPKEFGIIDDFSKAAIYGTISRDGDYIPTVLSNYGGKTMAIDEWNSIGEYGQRALLGLLENQEMHRAMGFRVKAPWKSPRNKYSKIVVKGNRIQATVNFSCMACAMAYPMPKGHVQVQTSKAILSRFLPIFIEADDEEIFNVISGHKKWKINDNSSKVDRVIITENAYQEYVGTYWDYIKLNNLIPGNPNDKGFMARVNSDIVRIAVAKHLPKDQIEFVIDDSKILESAISFSGVILRNYMFPFTQGKYIEFKRLYGNIPGKELNWYAEQIGVTPKMIKDYCQKAGIAGPETHSGLYNNIKAQIKQEYITRGKRVSISALARIFDVSWSFVRESIQQTDYDVKNIDEYDAKDLTVDKTISSDEYY